MRANVLSNGSAEWSVNGWRVAGAVLGERGAVSCQDRAICVPIDGGVVVAVADGAGGRAGGARAADAVVEGIGAAADAGLAEPWKADTWVHTLRSIDAQVASAGHGGESTAVVLALGERLVGASVGDSAAWVVEPSGATELTRGQQRRPVIGSGSAAVSPIVCGPSVGTVLAPPTALPNTRRAPGLLRWRWTRTCPLQRRGSSTWPAFAPVSCRTTSRSYSAGATP